MKSHKNIKQSILGKKQFFIIIIKRANETEGHNNIMQTNKNSSYLFHITVNMGNVTKPCLCPPAVANKGSLQ